MAILSEADGYFQQYSKRWPCWVSWTCQDSKKCESSYVVRSFYQMKKTHEGTGSSKVEGRTQLWLTWSASATVGGMEDIPRYPVLTAAALNRFAISQSTCLEVCLALCTLVLACSCIKAVFSLGLTLLISMHDGLFFVSLNAKSRIRVLMECFPAFPLTNPTLAVEIEV